MGGDQLSSIPPPISNITEREPAKAAGAISPLEGEMAGRPEGGAKE
jgi:hypothetical protein